MPTKSIAADAPVTPSTSANTAPMSAISPASGPGAKAEAATEAAFYMR